MQTITRWFIAPQLAPISARNGTLRRAAQVVVLTRRNGWYR